MKTIYKITKGQIITMWVFGFIFVVMAADSYSGGDDMFAFFISFLIIFYTIGWRNYRKDNKI